MMRIALISDVHGNLVALEAVLADLRQHGAFDEMIVAGDLVWSGPWPAEVVDLIRASGAAVIQGNTDAFFRRRASDVPPGKQDGRFAEQFAWMSERLGPEMAKYLANLSFSHRISPAPGHDLLVVHANPHDLDRPITPATSTTDLDNLLLAKGNEPDWATLAFGHIHVPFARRWRGRLLVDVASAGLPMDGDPRAVYAILTWTGKEWQAEHRRVFYEVPVVAHQMREGGMPRGKHFAERLMTARYSLRVPMATAAAE